MDILLLEDDELDARRVGEALSRTHCTQTFSVIHVPSLAVALARMERDDFDAVIVDLNLPDADGSEAVDRILHLKPHTPIIILSGNDDEDVALKLIHRGAQDFLVKGKQGFVSLPRTLRFCAERKAAEQRLPHIASYDGLTGLANRQEIYTQLRKACAHSERQGDMVALILIDLDRFKDANATYGHQVGDALLRTVGKRLRAVTRDGDTAGRLGGDEFAVILEGISHADAARGWAERALTTLHEPVRIGDLVFPLRASMGGALYPTHGAEVDVLFKRADNAMYWIKANGHNGVAFYDETMGRKESRQAVLAAELADAIESGAITAVFQPKVSLVTGDIVGFEALCRWQRAEGDPVNPGEFLPIARRLRLMPALGRRMRTLAMQAIEHWRARTGRSIPVSVNMDPQEVQSAEHVEELIRDVCNWGMPPQLLRLEVTENAVIENISIAAANLGRIAEVGMGIEMDDFGAGHSSLNYLTQFPIDTLKLDRSLIDKLGTDSQQNVIVKTLITLGNNLGVNVVAEGLETRIQLRALMRMGCKVGQGFLLGRPMPLDETFSWMTSQASRLDQKLETMTGMFEAIPMLDEEALRKAAARN